MIDIDFETRSKIDIKMGPWRYAADPSTSILCMAYKIEDGPVNLWLPGMPRPDFVTKEFWNFFTVVAHNVGFEKAVWREICVKRYGWPDIPDEVWQCSAAKCAAHALPRDLKRACIAMNTDIKKDDEGYRVMRKLSAPRKPTKNNPKTWWEPEDVPKDFETLYSYCKSDVGAEASLNGKLKDLSRQEYKVWALDQEINSRGVFLDFEAVKGSIKIIEEYRNRLLPRVAELSDNAFETVDQLLEMKRWLLDRFGIDMPSLAAELIDEMLENEDLPEDAREMLKLRRILSKSSTKKLYAMLGSICEDGRVKDLLMYHGASTGRWCMPGDAEVFTAEFGWRTLKSLAATTNKKRRSILVFDPNTSDLSFQPSRVNKFESPEQLYTLENPLVSGCFTEEHKLPGLTSRKNFTVKSAGENPRMDMLVSGYLRGHWFGTPGVYFGERQTRVLLMAQADGHFIENTRNGRGLRFRFKKERKIARCTYLLDNAEIPFKKKKDKDGVTIIWVRFADFPVWLGSWCKKSDYKWVSGCTPEVFCDELKFWDSHAPLDTSFEFSTTEKANAEWAQTMGHMCGWFVRIVERPVETRPRHWGLSYRVYFKRAHTVRISQKDWQVQNAPTKDGFVYCPETPTGFFLVRYNGTVYITGNSGKGIQIQNFPRRKVDDLDQKMHCLATGDLDRILFLYGDPMDMVSSCLRGMIVAEPGNCLYVADYAAIEARGVCWLAGQEDSLQLFRQDKDAYKVMASSIYGGKPISQITGDERQLGKQAVLGCGYGMGAPKFQITCQGYGMAVDEALAEKAVTTYRDTNDMVVKMWYNQERAAKLALTSKKVIKCGRVRWGYARGFLYCRLPSGRCLAYPAPKIIMGDTPWGEKREQLSYMSMNSKNQWVRTRTYGGKIVENITQATCRDVMAEAMLRLKAAGYPILFTVHDEIVCETPDAFGSVDEFIALLTEVPKWAKGFPIKAEGHKVYRYQKL